MTDKEFYKIYKPVEKTVIMACKKIFRQNSHYQFRDILNRARTIVFLHPNVTDYRVLYPMIVRDVSKDLAKEEGIYYQSDGQKQKAILCSLDTSKPIELEDLITKKELACDDLFQDMYLYHLTSLESAVLTLFYDLNTPEILLGKYKEIASRFPGKWTIEQISKYFHKEKGQIQKVKTVAMAKLKKSVVAEKIALKKTENFLLKIDPKNQFKI